MFKSGLVLAASNGLAFLANLLCSYILPQQSYGKITTYYAAASIGALILSFGFTGYYLSNLENYQKYRDEIRLTPFLTSLLLAIVTLSISPTSITAAFCALTIATTLHNQLALSSQIRKFPLHASIYQSAPSIIKSAATAILITYYFTSQSREKAEAVFNLAITLTSALSIAFVATHILPRRPLSLLSFIKSFSLNKTKNLFWFWASPLLALSYSLGLPLISAHFHNYAISAYFGIYLIFWSANSIFLTAIFNNRLTPELAHTRNEKKSVRSLSIQAAKSSVIAGIATLTLTLLGGILCSKLIWHSYSGIFEFVLAISIALFIRSLAAGVGIFINFPPMVKYKSLVQIPVLLGCIFSLSSMEANYIFQLSSLIIAIETSLLFGYSVILYIFRNEHSWQPNEKNT